ncbi:MAG TPA: phytanoyl-CoA dioxygenase family protein [Coleofasciculaceae cyanobacterium]
MEQAAQSIGVTDLEIVAVEVPMGSAVIHHGYTWHGSDPNLCRDGLVDLHF